MLKHCLIIAVCYSLISCGQIQSQPQQNQTQETKDSIEIVDDFSFEKYDIVLTDSAQSYQYRKNEVSEKREQLLKEFNSGDISLDSVGQVFNEILLNNIIPHWYGTDWDFNGHTNTPNKGYIACGYFVSTTLKHMGININRYRLAQQSGANEAKSISINDTIYKFYKSNAKEIVQFTKNNLEEGIYFVGLNNHVGFILHKKGEVFFIHSSFMGKVKVDIEKAVESEPFTMSTVFHITSVSTNTGLMKKWLNNELVKVYLD